MSEFDKANLDLAIHYLNERELVRQRKEQGVEQPLTNDPILLRYKFTNVLRRHDRTTRGLLRDLYLPNANAPGGQILLNCILSRYFGTHEFMQDLGWQSSYNSDYILSVVRQRRANKQRVFTGAYVITNGGIKGPKEEVILEHYIGPISKDLDILSKIAEDTQSWQAVAERMYKYKGFGGTGFITKEVLQDAILTPLLHNAHDRFTWTPCGPGAARGINRLCGLPLETRHKRGEALERMRQIRTALVNGFGEHMSLIAPEFDLHSTQFALCEIDKYLRVYYGQGKPRSRYTPDSRPLP